VGLDPQETFTKHDKTRNVQNSIGIQIVKLNPISEKLTTEERMRGKQKLPEEKHKEEYPKAHGWLGNDFEAGSESLRQIIF
jgi:hypothetical protein